MSFLDGLNTQQHAAVTADFGPTLVLAGPGSGKTRVLTHRIAYLISEKQVDPWQIIALTFTNKAAKEMNHRIADLIGERPRGLTMGTFHSISARILRREAESLGSVYTNEFVIFDTDDQTQVVKQALKDLNLDDKKFRPRNLLNGISSAKNELITPELYAATTYISEVTKRVYAQYQALLYANNAMDFDDLLSNMVYLFDQRPDVLARYQQQYQHVMVDEFQDTNTVQYGMLKRLAALHNQIYVVGDADQSIYKWRGADVRNIMRFREMYPNRKEVLLEQNYRSTQNILDAARAVIQHNNNRVDKNLFTERLGGEKIALREAYNETEEADQVVNVISGLSLSGYDPGDFAVMYRTNAQSRVLEEAFLRRGLPYRLVGATKFYGRKEVKDLLAYMRLIHNVRDDVSFNRAINTPTRGIGAKSQQVLKAWGKENGWQAGTAVINLAKDLSLQHPFKARAQTALQKFGHMLSEWVAMRDSVPVGDLLQDILRKVDFRNFYDDGTVEGASRWENVLELVNVAKADDQLSLSDFLEKVALVADTDNLEDTSNAPTLLTFHASKGLEFPVVIMTGLEEGLVPHSRSMDSLEDLEEERRLFYVGLTRAKDRIYLFNTYMRTVFGESNMSSPSRFLNDLPPALMDADGLSERRHQTKQRASSWNWESSRKPSQSRGQSSQRSSQPRKKSAPRRNTEVRRPAANRATQRSKPLPKPAPRSVEPERQAPVEAQFSAGQKVTHAKFGEGIVIGSRIAGSDEEVTVNFKKDGVKKLAASFAKLEKL